MQNMHYMQFFCRLLYHVFWVQEQLQSSAADDMFDRRLAYRLVLVGIWPSIERGS